MRLKIWAFNSWPIVMTFLFYHIHEKLKLNILGICFTHVHNINCMCRVHFLLLRLSSIRHHLLGNWQNLIANVYFQSFVDIFKRYELLRGLRRAFKSRFEKVICFVQVRKKSLARFTVIDFGNLLKYIPCTLLSHNSVIPFICDSRWVVPDQLRKTTPCSIPCSTQRLSDRQHTIQSLACVNRLHSWGKMMQLV